MSISMVLLTLHHIPLPLGRVSPVLQVLPGGGGGAPGVRHRQAPDLRERGVLAEGAARPRGQQHRHHAGGQQE